MGARKSYFTNDFRIAEKEKKTKNTNIGDILKRNKTEERREEIKKIYTILGCVMGLVFVFGILLYF